MALNVVSLKCPSCGAGITTEQKECEYCGAATIISSFSMADTLPPLAVNKHIASYREALSQEPDNREINTSVGMCFLKLRQYDHALAAFEKCMEFNFDNPDVFFCAAVCLLKGKMPFLHQRPTIDKILSYMESAMMIESKGIYYYFLAYIKYDYFKRKFLNTTPDYTQCLAQARAAGVSDYDIQQLYAMTGTQRPSCL